MLQALISIDPARAREDPVIVKNVPYYEAKNALEAEVMRLDSPPRPQNWGVNIILFWTWTFTLCCNFLSFIHGR